MENLNSNHTLAAEHPPDLGRQLRDLLSNLRARGCTIRLSDDGRLHINPRKLVIAEESNFIKENRDELVAIVRNEQQPAATAVESGEAVSGLPRTPSEPAAGVSSANGGSSVPDANQDVLGGAAIKLSTICEQQRQLAEAIPRIRAKCEAHCQEHPQAMALLTLDGRNWQCETCSAVFRWDEWQAIVDIDTELAALAQGFELTRKLTSELQQQLADAAETKED